MLQKNKGERGTCYNILPDGGLEADGLGGGGKALANF